MHWSVTKSQLLGMNLDRADWEWDDQSSQGDWRAAQAAFFVSENRLGLVPRVPFAAAHFTLGYFRAFPPGRLAVRGFGARISFLKNGDGLCGG